MQHRRKRGQPVRPQVVCVERRVRCLVMSRVVGYLSDVSAWNFGKKQEFKDRRTYDISGV